MLSIGAIIWVSVRPLLRLMLNTACGYIITKADIFSLSAARGLGQVVLNVTLPALMFSKIVPAFTSDNISALGPLVLVAVIYEALGILIAWLVKQFFWVPHRFRYGIIVAGGWNNVGDVPTAVIMSITSNAPFQSSDETIAIAYLSGFFLVFLITLFPMGGHILLEWDYRGPEVDDEEVRMSIPNKTKQSLLQLSQNIGTLRRRIAGRPEGDTDDAAEKGLEECNRKEESMLERKRREEVEVGSERWCTEERECALAELGCDAECVTSAPPKRCQKHVSFRTDAEVDDDTTAVPTPTPTEHVSSPSATANDGIPSRITSPAPSLTRVDSESASGFASSKHVRFDLTRRPTTLSSETETEKLPESVGPSITVQPRSRALHHRVLAGSRTFLRSLLTVQTITICVSLLIALVPTLKALFTPVDNSPIPNAPDGQPPLAFILDTASFIGAASVPMGLVCLGSALARLHVPRSQWRTLPLGAISALAVGKMVLTPILGVLIVQGLTNVGLIDRNNAVLRFVSIFLSCIPTATTQVYLTQVYSGTGDAATLSAFLIPQYALMFITMTVLTAYTLSLIF